MIIVESDLVDDVDLADLLHMPADAARAFMWSVGRDPVGDYRGRPLWAARDVVSLLDDSASEVAE